MKFDLAKLIQEAGFADVGWATANSDGALKGYQQWLEAGRHGPLAYLEHNQDIRKNPHQLLEAPAAGFLVVLLPLPFFKGSSQKLKRGFGWVARYARGRDYHKVMRKRLVELAKIIQSHMSVPDFKARALVDSAPVLEKDLAVQAGLGWIGRNGLLITKRWGSSVLIGSLLLSHRPPGISDQDPMPDHCGRCRACLETCPTQALDSLEGLNADRCISTWSIESHDLPTPQQVSQWGSHLFGCDLCQDVCPWNRFARDDAQGHLLKFKQELQGVSIVDFLTSLLHDPEHLLAGSALRRIGRLNLFRNALIVAHNQSLELPEDLLEAWRREGKPYSDMMDWALSLPVAV